MNDTSKNTSSQPLSVDEIMPIIVQNIKPSINDLHPGYRATIDNFYALNNSGLPNHIPAVIRLSYRVRESYLIPANSDPQIVASTHSFWNYALFLNILGSITSFQYGNLSPKQWLQKIVPDYAKRYLLDQDSTTTLFQSITGYLDVDKNIEIHCSLFPSIYEANATQIGNIIQSYLFAGLAEGKFEINDFYSGVYVDDSDTFISDKFLFRFLKKHAFDVDTKRFLESIVQSDLFELTNPPAISKTHRTDQSKLKFYRVRPAPTRKT